MAIYRMPVLIQGPAAGGPYINVWHFRVSSTPVVDGSLNTVTGQIRAFYQALTQTVPNVGPILAPNMNVTAEFATNVETQEQFAVSWTPLSTGTFGTWAPTRLAMAVQWKTSIAARRARGRTFVGPLQNAVVDTLGTPKAPVVTALKAAADALVNSSLLDDLSAVGVWGLQTPGGGPDSPHVIRDITGSSVKTKFATLRTRG
jgi:hypothetical protein